MAINWREQQVLIGEAKWADEPPDRKDWREFDDRVQKVRQRLETVTSKTKKEPKPWQLNLVFFSRRAVTPALRAEALKVNARIITFAEMVRDLEQLPDKPIR